MIQIRYVRTNFATKKFQSLRIEATHSKSSNGRASFYLGMVIWTPLTGEISRSSLNKSELVLRHENEVDVTGALSAKVLWSSKSFESPYNRYLSYWFESQQIFFKLPKRKEKKPHYVIIHGDINCPPNPVSRWFLVNCPPYCLIMDPFRWWCESHWKVKCLQAGGTNPSWCSGTSITDIWSFLKIKWMWRVLFPQNVSEAQVLVRRPIAHASPPSPCRPRVALVQIRSTQWMWGKSFRGSAHRVVNYHLSRWTWDQCRRGTGANGTHTRNDTCKAGKRLTEEMVQPCSRNSEHRPGSILRNLNLNNL